ncbi:MAG: hypothetical protein ACRDK2_00785 [Solirubrobacteraceae bacterium]
MSKREQIDQPESDSTSFEIDGEVEGSMFEDIDSTADKFMKVKGLRSNIFSRIHHHPGTPSDDAVNWIRIGALASVAGVIAVIVIALLS